MTAQTIEDQIEAEAERKMDRLDRDLLNGCLTQPQYDLAVKQLDDWAREEFALRTQQFRI